MNGDYLGMQIRYAMRPIIAFREYIFGDVLPAFGDLEKRANKVATEYYKRILSEPVAEYDDVDMASAAEDADARSQSWFQMMYSLRQTMRNLLAAGLFHLTEQQLASLGRDVSFGFKPPETKLDNVAAWYKLHLELDLRTLPSWAMMDELRLVANAVKHGEGSATRRLLEVRPELFKSPDYAAHERELGLDSSETPMFPITAPLAGEDLFVSEELLKKYGSGAEAFFEEIAKYFEAHGHDWYPVD